MSTNSESLILGFSVVIFAFYILRKEQTIIVERPPNRVCDACNKTND